MHEQCRKARWKYIGVGRWPDILVQGHVTSWRKVWRKFYVFRA